jgi:hypothetical protein
MKVKTHVPVDPQFKDHGDLAAAYEASHPEPADQPRVAPKTPVEPRSIAPDDVRKQGDDGQKLGR